MKKVKNQRGAISLFVILAMLFFMAFMIGAYSITTRRNSAQLDAARETAKIYSMGVDPNTAYDSMLSITSGSVVPISTIEQLKTLKAITENDAPEVNYTINGKLYTYKKYKTPTDDATKPNITYILNNDIILDLETEINKNKMNVNLYDYMLYDKTNYNINLNNHNIYYRFARDNSLWKCVFYQNNYKTDLAYNADTDILGGGSEDNFINVSKDNAKKSFTPRLYSILDGGLTSFKNSNSSYYEFLLAYNCDENGEFNITDGVYNRWSQTNDPTKETEVVTTTSDTTNTTTTDTVSVTQPVAGYSPISIGLTTDSVRDNYWGGLTLSTSAAAYLDGSVGHNDCYYSVGTVQNFGRYGTPVSDYNNTATGGKKALNSASQTLLFTRAK